jgi:hypothetical protein
MPFDPYAFDRKTLAGRRLLPDTTPLADTLADMPQRARKALCDGLRDAVEGALDAWERTSPGVKREPLPFLVQHVGQPHFNAVDLRWQTLDGWHQLMGLELRLTVQVLEALVAEDRPVYREMLAEQYTRVGQLYCEMKRRANEWVAQAQLAWELRLLRYRASPVVCPLVYE